MKSIGKNLHSYLMAVFLIMIIFILISIILNPNLSFYSVNEGFMVWFNIIFPSLLPFFIISEILIGSGFIDLLGSLLNPLMIPVFNVPGKGGFPLIMSLLSGYPVGSRLTSRLREENFISKNQGDRLICFTSSSGPLFILGAVSLGLLGDSSIGILIIIPHYLSILLLGLIFRNYKYNSKERLQFEKISFNQLANSFSKWINTKKSIGSLITKSIKESMDNIFLIGGLVIFYSVLIEVLFNNSLINNLFKLFSKATSLNPEIIKGFTIGIFEITMGCKNLALSNINMVYKIILINFIIGWGGLSVHSQALSSISKTDINSKLYIFSKLLHGIFSSAFSYLLYILKFKNYISPVMSYKIYNYKQINFKSWFNLFLGSTKLCLTIVVYLFILSLFVILVQKKYHKTPN